MKIYIYYTISLIVGAFYLQPTYAANEETENLSKLKKLAEKQFLYDNEMTIDHIIVWEKQLEPQIEKSKEYQLLFQLKQLVVSAYARRGDITIAVDRAQNMYLKAKEMGYNLGIVYSLQAIGDAYLSANMREQAINFYTNALTQLNSTDPKANQIKALILPSLTLTLIHVGKLDQASDYIKQLEECFNQNPTTINRFYTAISKAYYYVVTNQPEKAIIYINKAEEANKQENYSYLNFILGFLRASHYNQNKQYELAMEQYDQLIKSFSPSYMPNQYIEANLQTAKILERLGETDKACLTYQKANALQDSLSKLSYTRQISKLRTIYQIDQIELESQEVRNQIIVGGIVTLLIILTAIIILIMYIKKGNRRLRRSQTKLEEAQNHAKRSILTKSIFLSNMSHEIRTPLNALSGFSSILTEESIDNETRQQCNDVIQQNSTLLLKLINDVIDLSNLEMEKLTFCFKQSDAIAICRNVVDTVEKVKQTQVKINFVTQLNTLPLITDDSRLQQVLINLLINATKFTLEGSITLEVRKESETEAIFSVSDTGCGIPLEKQSKIFNRFEKLNEDAQGTGLGLSICQIIIEQMEGKIHIDSTYTHGARFVFTHPIHPINT